MWKHDADSIPFEFRNNNANLDFTGSYQKRKHFMTLSISRIGECHTETSLLRRNLFINLEMRWTVMTVRRDKKKVFRLFILLSTVSKIKSQFSVDRLRHDDRRLEVIVLPSVVTVTETTKSPFPGPFSMI